MSFQDGQNFSRATTPGRSLVENLKPISRKLDNKDMHPKNDLTKHFKDFMSSNSTNLKRVRSFSQPKETGESRIKFSSNIKDINSTCVFLILLAFALGGSRNYDTTFVVIPFSSLLFR